MSHSRHGRGRERIALSPKQLEKARQKRAQETRQTKEEKAAKAEARKEIARKRRNQQADEAALRAESKERAAEQYPIIMAERARIAQKAQEEKEQRIKRQQVIEERIAAFEERRAARLAAELAKPAATEIVDKENVRPNVIPMVCYSKTTGAFFKQPLSPAAKNDTVPLQSQPLSNITNRRQG